MMVSDADVNVFGKMYLLVTTAVLGLAVSLLVFLVAASDWLVEVVCWDESRSGDNCRDSLLAVGIETTDAKKSVGLDEGGGRGFSSS